MLEEWLRSYRPEELFDASGGLLPELRRLAPVGDKRMGATPFANGGRLRLPLNTPNWRDYALEVPAPGKVVSESTRALGSYLADVLRLNAEARNFRMMSPD